MVHRTLSQTPTRHLSRAGILKYLPTLHQRPESSALSFQRLIPDNHRRDTRKTHTTQIHLDLHLYQTTIPTSSLSISPPSLLLHANSASCRVTSKLRCKTTLPCRIHFQPRGLTSPPPQKNPGSLKRPPVVLSTDAPSRIPLFALDPPSNRYVHKLYTRDLCGAVPHCPALHIDVMTLVVLVLVLLY